MKGFLYMDREQLSNLMNTLSEKYISEENTITYANLQIVHSLIIDLFEIYLDGFIQGRKS